MMRSIKNPHLSFMHRRN